jgi:hypothetical protein
MHGPSCFLSWERDGAKVGNRRKALGRTRRSADLISRECGEGHDCAHPRLMSVSLHIIMFSIYSPSAKPPYNQYCPSCCSRLTSSLTAATLARPGSTTFHVPRAASARRTVLCTSSCSFGTSASFARLPSSDVVFSSSVKVGGMCSARLGAGVPAAGGVTTTCDSGQCEDLWSWKGTCRRGQERERDGERDGQPSEPGFGEVDEHGGREGDCCGVGVCKV